MTLMYIHHTMYYKAQRVTLKSEDKNKM